MLHGMIVVPRMLNFIGVFWILEFPEIPGNSRVIPGLFPGIILSARDVARHVFVVSDAECYVLFKGIIELQNCWV